MSLAAAFEAAFGRQPAHLARAPGRANLMGGHIDYSEGPVLPVTVDLEVLAAVGATADGRVRLRAIDLAEETQFHLHDLERGLDTDGVPLPGWARYPAGVAWALQQEGYRLPGLEAVYRSSIPIGAGLSSSAAVEVAFGLSWCRLAGFSLEPLALAQICLRSENDYVGVACGLMDPFACLFGRQGHALYFDPRTLEWEHLPLPASVGLVVADSGVRRQLLGSEFNSRRAEVEQAVEQLRWLFPGIRTLRDVSKDDLAEAAGSLPELVQRRARYVVEEIERVRLARAALRAADIQAVGRLMLEGHAAARRDYGTSIPEMDLLVEFAGNFDGCFGARMTGGGFGGCSVNLVETSRMDAFGEALATAYRQKTGSEATLYFCRPSDGAAVTGGDG